MTSAASAALTPFTKAGRVLAKGISKLFPVDSASHFEIVIHRVHVPRLPDAFESLRIVQLSDVHFYEFSCPDYYQSVVDTVHRLNADLIVTTGDIIHYGQHYLEMGHDYLKQLVAPLGKWSCMGNHDYSDDYKGQAVRKMLTDSGFNVLVNDAAPVEVDGKRLWLSGVDDYVLGRPDIDKAYAKVDPNEAHFGLIHNPKLTPHIMKQRHVPDVIVGGHTHGGQIKHALVNWIHNHIVNLDYEYGWYDLQRAQLYVSSGIGSATVAIHHNHFDFALYPFRINTTAEIAVFDLTSEPLESLN